MTKRRDPEALLTAYLADGMEVLPDRVVDSVLVEVHRTRQRVIFRPWRTRSSMFKTAIGAAAVVTAVALGSALLMQRGLPTVAGPSPTRSADPGPSLRAVVPPSSTLSQPSLGPSPSAITSSTGYWIPTGPMAMSGVGPTAVRLVDGRVLARRRAVRPASGTWSATGSMIHRPDGFAATLLRDGRVLAGDALDDAGQRNQRR